MELMTQSNIDTMMACRYCPMCRHACPSGLLSHRESDTTRGRAMLLYSVYRGGRAFDETTVQTIYNSFQSGASKSWCKGQELGGFDIAELLLFARRDIVRKGLVPLGISAIKNAIITKGNTRGLDKELSYTASTIERTADVLYILGEGVNYHNQEIAKSFTNILEHLKISYTLLKEEPTSGKELELLGYRNEAQEAAEHMARRIQSTGCNTIVVADPLVYDALKNNYPAWGIDLKADILHVSEYILRIINSGEMKLAPTLARVTIADSEYLGRFNGIYEAPRAIIKSTIGADYVEMKWHHEYMQSTGEAALTFDGKLFTRSEELGSKISQKAEEVNAQIIVTLSATAKNAISGTTTIQVMDIAEFVHNFMQSS